MHLDTDKKEPARPLKGERVTISTRAGQTMPGEPAFRALNRLLDEREAAALLGVSVAFMRKMRRLGTGQVVTRIGRLVRYSESDLAAFIAASRGKVA